MRLLPLMLLVVCCSASAEWQYWTGSDDGREFYVDSQSLEKNGDTRKFWVLENYPTADEGVLSTITLFEIACIKKRKRSLQQYWYTEHFGGGDSITPKLKFPGDWRFAAPGTVLAEMIRLSCKK